MTAAAFTAGGFTTAVMLLLFASAMLASVLASVLPLPDCVSDGWRTNTACAKMCMARAQATLFLPPTSTVDLAPQAANSGPAGTNTAVLQWLLTPVCHRCGHAWAGGDSLFRAVTALNEHLARPFGSVLDAG